MANLGIDDDTMIFYIQGNHGNLADEYINIQKILWDYKYNYARSHSIDYKHIDIKFINWGMEALVFVMQADQEYYTLLLGQPRVEYGTLKHQAKLLSQFNKIDNSVIAPVDFFNKKSTSQEMIITPYIYQARCISTVKGQLGVYVPEPKYHFDAFDKKAQSIVKSGIIAKLISCYDESNQQGIANVQVFSGDFVLDKEYDTRMNIAKTVEHMSVIACRDVINCTLSEYIDIIKSEFIHNSRQTDSFLPNPDYRVNTLMESPLTNEEIDAGIRAGLEIRQNRQTKFVMKK